MSVNRALVIGVGEYPDAALNLPSVAGDVRGIAKLLGSANGSFSDGNIRVLTDGDATREEIVDAIREVLETASANDTVFVYLAGHGSADSSDDSYYFIPHDINPYNMAESAVDLREVREIFQASSSQRAFMWLDFCHSGGIIERDMPTIEQDNRLIERTLEVVRGQGKLIYAACTPEQKAYENQMIGHGLFTAALLDGLRGAATVHGEVTANSLFDHIDRTMGSDRQRPMQFGHMTGRVVLMHFGNAAPATPASPSQHRHRPLIPVASDEEQFEEELTQIQSGLADVLKDKLAAGGWSLIVYPSIYRSDRWEDNEELESMIRRQSVRIRDEFPPSHRGTHRREWGICNDTYRDIWTLASSGLFACWKPYWENDTTFKNPYQGEPNIEPGKWLDFQPNVYNIIEMFMFMVRFVEEFEPGEEFSFRLRADSLAGRKLVSTNPRIRVSHGPPEPCRADVFEKKRQLTVEDFRADWKRMCAATLKDFFEFFPSERIQVETMLNWVEKFESRDF